MDKYDIEPILLDVSNINQDPESQIGSPYPMWFVILKKKYESHSLELHQAVVRHAESPVVPANGVKFTLGRFCVFLSHCVEKTVELSPEEWDALQEVGCLSFTYLIFAVIVETILIVV